MFFVKLIRYIKSYVRFSMTGGFVERFINLCSRNGIPLWDVEPTPGGMEANTTVDNYRGMRQYAKRSGVRIRVKERHGLRFAMHRYRHRRGFAVGILIFVCFLIFMSNFIWKVEVYGLEDLTEQEVLIQLEELGVRPGSYKRGIDTRWVEQNMLVRVNELSWIAVNLKGSTAQVEIKERVMPPEIIDDEGKPTNVVASDTGQIKSMEVYDGQALLKVGDTVLEGDIIVSGILETQKGVTILKHARAKVMAQIERELEVQVPLEQVVYYPTGKTVTKRALGLFGFDVPMSLPGGLSEYYNKYSAEKPLSILGMELPFSLKITAYELLDRQIVTYTEEQAKREALAQMELLERQTFPDCEILDVDVSARMVEDTYILRVNYKVLKDIAQVREILMNE